MAQANQARQNGFDHTHIMTSSATAPAAFDKKAAPEGKSLGRRMSLFGKSNGKSNGGKSTANSTSGGTSVGTPEKSESPAPQPENDNANKLVDVMNTMFESNSQTSYADSKKLYPGLQGILLGARYPGQNIPVVGFTEDPFAVQETRKRSALVKGPIINLDLSYAGNYGMEESLFTTLKDIFECMAENQSRIGVVSPAKLIEVLKRENELFRTTMHQDAHEFLNFLLNEVIENVDRQNRTIDSANSVEVNGAPSNPSSSGSHWVHDLFEGLLTSETKCLTCETVSRRDEKFLDLSIDIERNSSVTACLRQFSASEMLCERNKFNCDNCGGLHEAEKRMKVKNLPKILALHLKRFKYTEDLQRNVKLFHRVVYPKHLRLDNTTDDAENKDKLYELYAVVVHIGGGPYHGHYVSIVKTETAGWLLFDDEMVEGVDPSYVFNFFGDNKGLAAAYVLFYQEITQEQYERENLYTNTAPPPASEVSTAIPSMNPSVTGLNINTGSVPSAAQSTSLLAQQPPLSANAEASFDFIPNEPHKGSTSSTDNPCDSTTGFATPKGNDANIIDSSSDEPVPVIKSPSSGFFKSTNRRSVVGLNTLSTGSALDKANNVSSGSTNSLTSGIQFWKKKDKSCQDPELSQPPLSPVESAPSAEPPRTPGSQTPSGAQTPVQKKKSRLSSFNLKKKN